MAAKRKNGPHFRVWICEWKLASISAFAVCRLGDTCNLTHYLLRPNCELATCMEDTLKFDSTPENFALKW
ncbi:uncharacterized protein SPAPADRAFT_62462 [Spathaspora passalidarum NRRL Y-27907]|uniref:Uncharacterized protein n=1 Tax=Spathaspora passalidarum (strain NRRL Y-27907 / 11-Y1) TaxID=619300 RepID=G3AS03_SPAPN|nr:uncharacterized protein SPAPADRAFT_62462 [Spathaspora passalidarum NRRL Y-27907]EGW31852.1 hypothetical protein SPAPADRAFT_62462 [Spathaspora passalidarum NRRL Y-27907]